MRFWSLVFFLATASLIYNSLFDEEHSGGVRALGILGAIVTFAIAVALWRRASRRAQEEPRSRITL